MDAPNSSAAADWLQRYLTDAVKANLCTGTSCTTCAAGKFRAGLLAEASTVIGTGKKSILDQEAAAAIGKALVFVRPVATAELKLEEAVRCVLFDLWNCLGESEMTAVIEPQLLGTWAGTVLARMKKHHQAQIERRRALTEYESAAAIANRREEKHRLKQQKHLERLERKKQIDHLWREKQHEKRSEK